METVSCSIMEQRPHVSHGFCNQFGACVVETSQYYGGHCFGKVYRLASLICFANLPTLRPLEMIVKSQRRDSTKSRESVQRQETALLRTIEEFSTALTAPSVSENSLIN